MLPGVPHHVYVLLDALLYSGSPSFLFYVWAGVTLLGVIGLVLILLRHFLGRPRANRLQHHPRLP
jgi:ABC-type bacteriocin/lantibiotic exporter with double-glycine peptidase domain